MSFDEDQRENECPCCNEYEKERLEQAKLIRELLEVVEFYGDRNIWFNGGYDEDFNHIDGGGEIYCNGKEVGGKKARAVLNSEGVKRFKAGN